MEISQNYRIRHFIRVRDIIFLVLCLKLRNANNFSAIQFNGFLDAANPYGKIVKAFMLMQGWHVRYLLILIASGLFCSICTIAISTVVSHSFEVGLTAGSYTCGLATALIAVFTFLSAIL